MSLNATDRAMVRAILAAARVKRSDIEWMVESCPSVERARELYSRSYRHPPDPPTRPPEIYRAVKVASDRLLKARRDGDTDKESGAFRALQTEIAIVYWQIERLDRGETLPELSAETMRNIDALDEVA